MSALAFSMYARPDYGPEIHIGARVQCGNTGRLGWVISLRNRCHWTCEESASQYRPRSAYVLLDESSPPCDPRSGEINHLVTGEWAGSYVPPESLSAVPAHWHKPKGAPLPSSLPVQFPRGLFGPAVVRLEPRRGAWLMGDERKGWGSFGYVFPTWAEAVTHSGMEPFETGRDDCSWLVRVRRSAP